MDTNALAHVSSQFPHLGNDGTDRLKFGMWIGTTSFTRIMNAARPHVCTHFHISLNNDSEIWMAHFVLSTGVLVETHLTQHWQGSRPIAIDWEGEGGENASDYLGH